MIERRDAQKVEMVVMEKSWSFKCRYDAHSGGFVLENSAGMRAGRALLKHTSGGSTIIVLNSRDEIALVLESVKSKTRHARLLVPRRAIDGTKSGLAIYGIIDQKASGFDHVYEYTSPTGSDVFRVVAECFPRRLIINKNDIRIAEIEKDSREMSIHVAGQARDTDVILIIGIMLAVCLLIPTRGNIPPEVDSPVILIK
ncbi:MAG: hypothetical protein Q6370_020365 [Candidatus Sigynarchaeota archaeon]